MTQDEIKKTATIKGWIARDKNVSHGEGLHLFINVKPERRNIMADWSGGWYCHIPLDNNLFPQITWETEPVEVELTIKLK